jgi:lysophospholipase L1-like esterase
MRRGGLVVAGVVVALGVLELGLRMWSPGLAAGSAARFELDPDLIYRLRADNAVRWSSPEFTEVSHTNALGLRGVAVAAKRPGAQRVLALGDSFTYGHGVQDDQAYPAVVETLLRARAHDVQVLNAGVPGYNTDQSYIYALRDGLALAPDVIVLGIHCSDVSDNYESSLYDVDDGRLRRRDARHTRMYELGSVVGWIPAAVRQSRTFELLVSSIEWHDAPATRPAVDDLDAWSYEKMRLEVADLQRRGAEIGTAVAVVLMPCKRALAATDADPYGPLAGDLRAAGVPVLPSTRALQERERDLVPLFFHDDPHLNVDGNRALARVVADFLEAQGLVAARPGVVAVRADSQ